MAEKAQVKWLLEKETKFKFRQLKVKHGFAFMKKEIILTDKIRT